MIAPRFRFPHRFGQLGRQTAMLPFLVALCLCGFAAVADAEDTDWSQWRGPKRDGHAAPQSLLSSWPDGGPKLKWSATDLGAGFSSISQSGDRLVTLGTEGQNCLAICLNAKDGSTIWKRVIGETATDKGYNTGWGGGPRSSPTISGDRVYVLSDLGQLAALRLSSGDPIWTVDLVGELGGKIPTWGYSASPLIDGDRVVIGVGGKSFLIALNKDTGNTLLRSSGSDEDDGSIDGAEYVSVMKHTVHGKSLYICASRSGLMGFDVESMKRTFHAPATGNRVAVIPTPICVDDLIYHTSAYGAGCQLVRVLPDGKTRIEYAKNNQTMENHHGGTVLVDNVIYGFSKQMGGGWMAHDFESGQNLWNERIRGVRSGSIAYADGLLYCYNANAGKLLLVRPNREKFELVGDLTIPRQSKMNRKRGKIWAHPVVSNGTLYLRDLDLLFAFDISGS